MQMRKKTVENYTNVLGGLIHYTCKPEQNQRKKYRRFNREKWEFTVDDSLRVFFSAPTIRYLNEQSIWPLKRPVAK